MSEVLSSMLYGRAGKDDWSRSSYQTLQSGYSKSPAYECLKIQVCVWMSSHVRTHETAVCPPSPIAEHPSALSSPTSSPSSNNSACLFIHCQPLYASWYTPLLFKVLDYKILNVSFSVFLMHYLCEKYYKPITVQYYVASCVSWVPRLTLLDLWTNQPYELTLRWTHSSVRELLYFQIQKGRQESSQGRGWG